MKRVKFTKMVASGNDFVVIESGHQSLVKKICDRKFGVGADGMLLLEETKTADLRMRIFNADGSEAEMCGNGARCAALYSGCRKNIKIETRAGIIEAHVNGDNVKIKLTDPKDIKLDVPIRINSHPLKVNFINTGVPHTVIFVEGLDKIDVSSLGRIIRYHHKFSPAGTNVDFVEVVSSDSVRIRTYERGVEDETLACGTGSAAAALIHAMRYASGPVSMIKVRTKGGEILKVYFDRAGNKFKNVWLEGKARIVYTGVYDV